MFGADIVIEGGPEAKPQLMAIRLDFVSDRIIFRGYKRIFWAYPDLSRFSRKSAAALLNFSRGPALVLRNLSGEYDVAVRIVLALRRKGMIPQFRIVPSERQVARSV